MADIYLPLLLGATVYFAQPDALRVSIPPSPSNITVHIYGIVSTEHLHTALTGLTEGGFLQTFELLAVGVGLHQVQ